MTRKKPKWAKQIGVYIPESWLDLIDQAKGDVTLSEWIRGLIRDALKSKGVWPEGDEDDIYKRR